MTRIIAGSARGIRLDVPAAGTRPTSDRVRESLFGALEAAGVIDGARVLDLYAGSGALGLEALSRGAASTHLVEKAAAAAQTARANAARVVQAAGLPASAAAVHRSDVATFLARTTRSFDVVFADPPYEVTDAATGHVLAALVPHLARDAIVILERAARSPEPPLPEGLVTDRHKRYGDTALWWLVPAPVLPGR
ncbi:16S rRNA (guanine(966)-N(2))-methyltransferase RsmD [Microbacterium protaetiae]|uniref:16S rRNA (Guanine(966)-N(2))-methyltransferase RsmD n=1 Tax=Microbacterium protaetiae TaxID=2509458 RepID=A0A4P6EFH5_9MICO|nr:16S rRNA (guanine(966)-N(2))-methyltransferase RsmD [Microbacterium protaetiae]QAY61122.1 16S rRNA (guanine(966)-N(2))-methyltransferase RsmD [Microbacterium protaetiae]